MISKIINQASICRSICYATRRKLSLAVFVLTGQAVRMALVLVFLSAATFHYIQAGSFEHGGVNRHGFLAEAVALVAHRLVVINLVRIAQRDRYIH